MNGTIKISKVLIITYRISVHNHPLTVIATDGLPVRPHVVDAITYFPGTEFSVSLYFFFLSVITLAVQNCLQSSSSENFF